VSELNSKDELSHEAPETSAASADDGDSPATENLSEAADSFEAEASPAEEDFVAAEDSPAAADSALSESLPAEEEATTEDSPVAEVPAAAEAAPPVEEPPAAEESPAVEESAAPEESSAAEPAEEEAAAEPEESSQNGRQIGVPGMDWYIIHTYSGFENKVKESLRSRAEAFGFGHRVGEILIPTEDVVEMRGGKKVTSKRMLYPGYVLVQLDMDDELWHVVKNTPRVTGFVGGGQVPTPLTADEVNQTLYRQKTSAEKPRPKMTFEKNDRVKIIDGPFSNFTGSVEEINEDRNTLKVMVTIFGRGTPVELEYFQVEKESG
jgi:transcription termination/antitermination protein NusG